MSFPHHIETVFLRDSLDAESGDSLDGYTLAETIILAGAVDHLRWLACYGGCRSGGMWPGVRGGPGAAWVNLPDLGKAAGRLRGMRK